MTYRGRLKGWETMSKKERQEALEQVIDKCRATVAGNIHDNPELVEVTE
jgi:uncharacterized protein YbjQ (UPF0145 family)